MANFCCRLCCQTAAGGGGAVHCEAYREGGAPEKTPSAKAG